MNDRLDRIDALIDLTADLIADVPAEAQERPTPCADYSVGDLTDHLVGWIHVFAAATHDTDASRDPASYVVTDGHAEEFRKAGHAAVEGLRVNGVDREFVLVANPIPGTMIADMMTMEYPGHGWDIAVATRQRYPFDEAAAEAALAAAERMIQPEYRGHGEGQFRPIVPTPPEASVVERFIAFLGRDPGWRPEAAA